MLGQFHKDLPLFKWSLFLRFPLHKWSINYDLLVSVTPCIYKLLSKLIVLRLKKFLPSLMHLAQSGFILGSQTTYNCIIALEMIHLINKKRGKKGSHGCQVDLERHMIISSGLSYVILFNFFIFPSK